MFFVQIVLQTPIGPYILSRAALIAQEAILGLPWVWIRTFGPRELVLWV